MKRKSIAITSGDPAGIGPEVVFRAVTEIGRQVPLRIYGDWRLTRLSLRQVNIATDLPVIRAGEEAGIDALEGIAFVDVGASEEESGFVIGAVSAAGGRAALAAIDGAVRAIEQNFSSAIVTAPIHKTAIRLAGAEAPGHTELLAARAGLKRYGHDHAMYFDSPTLRVALLTVHEALKDVPRLVTAENISALALLVDREVERLEGKRPRIVAAGLNPHAGEGGLFGAEDEEIARGVEIARKSGIEIDGPLPADTLFHLARQGRWDVVLAMYHDQGLIPVKTLHVHQAVNVTLGLPYLRVSVDHGTAFDIAGKGVADHSAMKHAIEWTIGRMAR